VKTLILLRHGKSDWDSDRDADHDRPLARRGRNAAATMGLLLERAGQVPDRALTSSALRATLRA
jgi:phosphohistidine phosphatase